MRYLVVDVESTGLDTSVDEIVEVAGVWREDGRLYFHTSLCFSPVHCPPEASASHHLVDSDLVGQPRAGEVISQMMERFGDQDDCVLVAHNAAFDRQMVSRACSGLLDSRPWICTWRCALHLWSEAPSYGNQVLRYWLNLVLEYLPRDLHPHRALYDAITTEALLRSMLMDHSPQELIRLSSTPVLLTRVRFGKYDGMMWRELPRDYLRWILTKGDFDEDTVHTARHYLGLDP